MADLNQYPHAMEIDDITGKPMPKVATTITASEVSLTIGDVKLAGNNVKLLDTVSVTGIGSLKPLVESFKTYVFEVWGTASSFSIQIQVVGPSGTPRNLKVWDELNSVFLTGNITASGFYSVSVPSFTTIQANVVSIAGGNVNVDGGLIQ